MNSSTSLRRTTATFSKTFERIVNFAAVSRVGNPSATIQGLVQMCLAELPDEVLCDGESMSETIEALFGLKVSVESVDLAIDELLDNGSVERRTGGRLTVSERARSKLQESLNDVTSLEVDIKSTWTKELEATGSGLSINLAWDALQRYLRGTFRQHGIQAAALLDESVDLPDTSADSLAMILNEAIREAGPSTTSEGLSASMAIRAFMSSVSSRPQRAKYIAQLADAAFNFYTLGIPKEVTSSLCDQLEELTIFLDTNFIFGILDLHSSTQVQASCELLNAVRVHNLPFKLRYHEQTQREIRNTIAHYERNIRSRRWPQAISRAAAKSGTLSGIEQKFHEKNGNDGVDVDEFFRILEHFDVTLKDHGIQIFRPHAELADVVNDIYHDYKDYLDRRSCNEKGYETLMHDATILAEARDQRTRAGSSLRAGAIIISCDYQLYRFDTLNARSSGQKSVVMLPNIFWQIIRPFLPQEQDYELAFAETFSLPQFRAFGSGRGGEACRKMLQILATYKDVPEESATKMLANGLLIDRLKGAEDNAEFKKQVELAIVEENRSLQEDKASIEAELIRQKRLASEQARQLADANLKSEAEKDQHRKLVSENELIRKESEQAIADRQSELETSRRKAEEAEAERRDAIARNQEAEQIRLDAERSNQRLRIALAFITSLLCVFAFLLFVHLKPWGWVVSHKNTIGIQAGIAASLVCICTGTIVPGWRKWCLGVALLAVLTTVLTQLGQ